MPQIIVLVLSIIMLSFIFNPIALINTYFLFTPLVHPFALDELKLFSLPISWPFTAIALSGVIFYLLTRKGFKLFPYNTLPLYFITFLSFLSLAFSINIFHTASQDIKFISALGIVLLVNNAATTKLRVINIYKGIVYSSIIPMLYGYYQYVAVQGHVVHGKHTDRLTSFFGFANLYGIFLALIIFSTIILYFDTDRRKEKYVYILILLSAIVSSVLSLNRGSWIAIILGLILSFPFYIKYLKIKYFIISFSIIGVAAAGIIIKRFLQLEVHTIVGNTFDERLNMWILIAGHLSEIPILGYGAGTAREVMEKLFNIPLVPHNDYLKLLIEIGFLGPFIYIVFLYKEFISNIKRRYISDCWYVNYFSLSMVFYWIIISFTQNIYHDIVTFPMFLSLCVLSRQYNKFYDKK